MLAAIDWSEVGALVGVIRLVFVAGAYGSRTVRVLSAPSRKRKAAADAEERSDRELLIGITAALITPPETPPTPLNPHPAPPPPGLIDKVNAHIEEDAHRWDEIAARLDALREGQGDAATLAATEVVKQINERERVQKRDAAQ